MLAIELRTYVLGALSMLKGVEQAIADKATMRALNDVAAKAKTQARVQIHAEYNLASSDVASMLFVGKASATKGKLWVTVGARSRRGRALNLIRFVERRVTLAEGRKRLKAGTIANLRVQIKRRGGAKLLGRPSWAAGLPFIMTNRQTGGTFVGARDTSGHVRGVYTIDVPSMFASHKIAGALMTQAKQDFAVRLKARLAEAQRGH